MEGSLFYTMIDKRKRRGKVSMCADESLILMGYWIVSQDEVLNMRRIVAMEKCDVEFDISREWKRAYKY